MTATSTAPTPAQASLVRLLGDTRAQIVLRLRKQPHTVAQLAEYLQISQVATRRHLTVLEDDGFVTSTRDPLDGDTVARGRPAAWFRLTDEARTLFPHRYDRLASEMMQFLTEQHGRHGLREFLRWRLERETQELRQAVTAEDLHERLDQLARKLSDAGYAAEVEPMQGGYRLVQNHCTIAEVAKQHPEVCAYEAAAFSQVLGEDVQLSRRDTLATGANACVCSVSSKASDPGEAVVGAPGAPPAEARSGP